MPSFDNEEPDAQSSSSRRRHRRSSKNFADAENSPLLAGPSTPVKRYSSDSLNLTFETIDFRSAEGHQVVYHSSDESFFFDFIMEKVKNTQLAYLANKIAVESEPGLTNAQLMLNNHDLKPVESERRQWGAWNFVGFWVADSFNINTWMISSSMIVQPSGLSWWQSWLCVWLGYSIAAGFVVLTGRIGATYHISFPVVSRSSFGIWGALWPVLNRAAMSCIWYGVQAWIGGECVKLMISAVWPSWSSSKIHNGISNSETNTVDFVSFIIFWVCSLPAIWFPVHKIRHLFTVKAYVVPTAGIAFFIWAVVRAHGLGPIVRQKNTSHGSAIIWAMVSGVMSAIANFATLIVNNPDFARFARKPEDAIWSQLITIPVGFAFTSFVGIIVSSSSTVIFGEPIWNPLELLQSFLNEGTAGNRGGVFIIAMAFALAQLGTNIAANSVSAGTDMTALLPRYINIRRGGYTCALIGLVICPWKLLSSTNKFITYLSAYSVFLSSIAGVIVADYYLVRRGYLQIKDLYSAKQDSAYYFWHGIHWRGYAAYIAGILINITGFVGAVNGEETIPMAANYIYRFNFFGGFTVSAVTYWALCKLFPVPATSEVWMEIGDQIEDPSMAYGDASGDYDDEEESVLGKSGILAGQESKEDRKMNVGV